MIESDISFTSLPGETPLAAQPAAHPAMNSAAGITASAGGVVVVGLVPQTALLSLGIQNCPSCSKMKDVGAPKVWVTHGREEALVHYARSIGIDAEALHLAGREEEGA